jgi:hypothetical protein
MNANGNGEPNSGLNATAAWLAESILNANGMKFQRKCEIEHRIDTSWE